MEAEDLAAQGKKLAIVDVGCGRRPYAPLFAAVTESYTGVDIDKSVGPDVLADAQELPLADASADVVLCLQTLHYLPDPGRAIAEASRILRPGGRALISTHGVAFLQLRDSDYFRWTHLGLERLFRSSAGWERIDVHPNGGSASAIAYLIGAELESLFSRQPAKALARGAIALVNSAALGFDRLYARRFPGRMPHGSPNYLVVARKGNLDTE